MQRVLRVSVLVSTTSLEGCASEDCHCAGGTQLDEAGLFSDVPSVFREKGLMRLSGSGLKLSLCCNQSSFGL